MKIRINTLWSLDNIKDHYVFDTETFDVINETTGTKLKRQLDKKGYPVVYLQRKIASKNGRMTCNVKFHKIVALSMVHNGPYKVIEHLDDNPLNFDPMNLKFSDQSQNLLTKMKHGGNRVESLFVLTTADGDQIIDTMKNLAKITGIARGTLYDWLYDKRRLLKSGRIRNLEAYKPGTGKRLADRDADGFIILKRRDRFTD